MLPEQILRNALLKKMVEELGFPSALIAVEKELSLLPHLMLLPKAEIPKRRLDILVFAKDIHPDFSLYPLLMIECKVVALTPNVAQQVIGYNQVVKAPYVAIANQRDILTGKLDRESGVFAFTSGLPTYSELLKNLSRLEFGAEI